MTTMKIHDETKVDDYNYIYKTIADIVEVSSTISLDAENKRREVEKKQEEDGIVITMPVNKDNVVSGDKLRRVQSITLSNTSKYLANTFGPMGTNTKIVTGVNQADVTSSYSKDGLKVLENIINSAPIEASIVDELISLTRAVEKEVGDGTTSTVILSSFIFDILKDIELLEHIPPFKLIRVFQSVVDEIKKDILSSGRECTLDDIYNIALICTNGNEEMAGHVKYVYENYGMDVDITVGISNTPDTVVKAYDGLTITEGMADPAYINNKQNNTCEIHDAHVYHFADPVDTMDQISLFEAILKHNIYDPYENNEDPIPTVITCPRFSVDMSSIMKRLVEQLYAMDKKGIGSSKPPILIVTNVIASDEVIMDDIANLCGCKTIHKYIDPNVYQKDIESGLAPSIDNVHEFCGKAELVIADASKTKFINPQHMLDPEDTTYRTMINFLETEIENTKSSDDANSIGLLKKRLSALNANSVDFLVGGVTIADRDMKKDLVVDAVKNCKSASEHGVGYAANFMGMKAAIGLIESNKYPEGSLELKILKVIARSYINITKILYSTVYDESDENNMAHYIAKSLSNGYPFNIASGALVDDESGMNVLCTIRLDAKVLDTISKIITMMVTCNQCLLMSSNVNLY